MPRIPLIPRPEDLPAAQQPIFARIARSRGHVPEARRAGVRPEAIAALRARALELTATVGYYAMLACTLNAFDVRPGFRRGGARCSVT